MGNSDPTGPAPSTMGASGGSGTRVVARIARRAGLFLGEDLNPAEDSLEIAEYYDRWINPYLLHRHDWGPEEEAAMNAELTTLLERHRAPADGGRWGWKEPRSIFLVSFLARALPGLRLVHVVRDGRDMAFSKNQNQPRKHADALLGPGSGEPDAPPRAIELWNAVNLEAADAGEAELGERYLRIRFEDLCSEPEPVIARVLDFLELEGDAAMFAQEIEPPPTLGRWRESDPALVQELERIAGPALERFGYLQ
jgi:sulfotransferase family protein